MIVQVIQPPKWDSQSFELCVAEGLGVIVHCKRCMVAVATWDSEQNIWVDEDGFRLPGHFVICWGGCKEQVSFPSRRFVQLMLEDQ